MRTCKKCLQTKPLELFVPEKTCKEGRTWTCIACRHIQRTALRKKDPVKYYANWATKNKEKATQIQKEFQKRNPKYAKRYKLKPTKRQPQWADIKQIQQIYANCPEGYHVDHIIPLRGKLVSGLHVPENLQYLPALDNIRKGNKYAIPT